MSKQGLLGTGQGGSRPGSRHCQSEVPTGGEEAEPLGEEAVGKLLAHSEANAKVLQS